MVPGDGSGTVGALLAALVPAQHYTHMGIMTRDRVEIRHCTASVDYLKAHPDEGAPPFMGNPTDGFTEDALRYGWPGTVTQPIEVAYRSSRGQHDGVDVPYLLVDPAYPALSTHIPSTKVDSSVLGDPLAVKGLDFEPVIAPVALSADADAMLDAIAAGLPASVLFGVAKNASVTWDVFWPLVVKPCSHNSPPHIVNALERVAAAAEYLIGHYRFHAYVDAQMAGRASAYGPIVNDAGSPDPDRLCDKPALWDHSLPLVCSTFIWEAVQEANRRRQGPGIFLTHPLDHSPRHNCTPFYQPPAGDVPDVVDGLFDYDTRQTARAAISLAAAIKRGIAEEENSLPWYLSWIGDIYEWFSDMQDDVSNQLCNAFAFDKCDPSTATEDDSWHHPPPSNSVSPDNIIRSWLAPLDTTQHDEIHGLYGYNEQAIFRPGHYELRRTSIRAFSAGPGRIRGLVRYGGEPVDGARVTVACRSTFTNVDGFYQMEVPAGLYMLKAGAYLPQPGGQPAWYIEGEMEAQVTFGETARLPTLEMHDPPGENRIVHTTGHADLVNRHTFGKDWWDHPAMNFQLIHLGNYGSAEGNRNSAHWGATIDSSYGVDVTTTAQRAAAATGDPYPVDIHVNAKLGSKGIAGWPFTPEAEENFDVRVPTDDSRSWKVDLKTGLVAPVRAHLEITFTNYRQG